MLQVNKECNIDQKICAVARYTVVMIVFKVGQQHWKGNILTGSKTN